MQANLQFLDKIFLMYKKQSSCYYLNRKKGRFSFIIQFKCIKINSQSGKIEHGYNGFLRILYFL